MAGFGSSLGVYPYGSGTPADTAESPDRRPLRARFIDPLTRDYVPGTDGELERMPTVRQQVMLACVTRRGSSSADPGLGIVPPTFIDANAERRMDQAVRSACSHITRADRAVILGVRLKQTQMGRVETTIEFRDLTTQADDFVTF